MASATHGEATAQIAGSAEQIYELVTDVTRMGERSPECYRCEWIDGATGAAVGARFRGRNRLGLLRWTTTCTVAVAEPGREFAFTVIHDSGREETRWRYLLEPNDAGTVLTESYEFLWCPLPYTIAELLVPRDRQLRRGIRQSVDRIKSTVESS